MADLPPYSDSGEGLDRDSSGPSPLWRKVLGWTLGLVLIVVFVGLHLLGVLGPGRH